MKKLIVAGTAGAALAYLFDRQQGAGRRRSLLSALSHGQDATLEAGQRAARALEPLTPVPTHVLDRIHPRSRWSGAKVALLRVGASVLVALAVGGFAALLRALRTHQVQRGLDSERVRDAGTTASEPSPTSWPIAAPETNADPASQVDGAAPVPGATGSPSLVTALPS